MYHVYILRLENGEYYTGYTSDLDKRVKDHKYRLVKSTKSRGAAELVFSASFNSKKKALDFEKYLKSSSGFAFRNKHFI